VHKNRKADVRCWVDTGIEIGKNSEWEQSRGAYDGEDDADSSENETVSFDGDTFLDHLTCSLGLADGTPDSQDVRVCCNAV